MDRQYNVFGLVHRAEQVPLIEERLPDVPLVRGDITDAALIMSMINEVLPDEIYNLAGFSFPPASVAQPAEAFRTNTIGAINVMESVRLLSKTKAGVKLYQASTSEMFGRTQQPPYDESTPFAPETPYAASKVAAHHLVSMYRQRFGIFAVAGILFNHESPLRPAHYVSRKISLGVARIALGREEPVVLGDLEAVRDWGFAKDYVDGMWSMMHHHEADDYVLATGTPHSVRDFVATAFRVVGIADWENHVEISPALIRPGEQHPPIGDPQKAARVLGWKAETEFEQLVRLMVEADVRQLKVSDAAESSEPPP